MTSDDGWIVAGWLAKLALFLGLLGAVAVDGIAVVSADLSSTDRANAAAVAAADTYKSTHDLQRSYEAAVAATTPGDVVDTKGFNVTANGRITLILHRTASTLWIQNVGPLKKYAAVRVTGTGGPGS